MAEAIDYYFSTLSTWSYLGHRAFHDMAARAAVDVHHKPVNLLKVFKATGGLPLGERPPARQAYRLVEMRRWRKARGLQMNLRPAFFPFNAKLADCVVIAAAETEGEAVAGEIAGAIMRGVWVEQHNLADGVTLADVVQETGHNGKGLVEAAKAVEVEARYRANTEEAIARGAFGAPSYFLGDELFWGQDRIDTLEQALS